MRTFVLNKDTVRSINAEEVCERLLSEASTSSNSVYPMYHSISGLFMFDKPVCVRTDISTLQNRSAIIGDETHSKYIAEPLRKNIQKWYREGKGDAIIHMRSYPPYTGRERLKRQGRKESYPHRIECTDGTYFYHLGGYGSDVLWNTVCSTRSHNQNVPEKVYDNIMSTPCEERINIHRYNNGDDDVYTPRTHNLVWWQNGKIIDEFRHLSDCGYPHIGSELIPVHTIEVTKNESTE